MSVVNELESVMGFLDDLLHDLDRDQLVALLNWVAVNRFPLNRAAVRGWRRRNGL
jgi:hypothetical protein